MAGRKFQIGNASLLSVYVDDIKLAGKKQNLDPIWKLLNKEVDLGEPTSFLDHVYLGCTQRQCEISKDIVDNYRTTSGGTLCVFWKSYICSKKLDVQETNWCFSQFNRI